MQLCKSHNLQTIRLNADNVVQIVTQNINTNLFDCILDIKQVTLLNTKTTLDFDSKVVF